MLNSSSSGVAQANYEEIETGTKSQAFQCPDIAMTELIDTHLVDLQRVSLSVCNNPDLASDVVQQTCLKAWMARARYDFSLPAKPWLFRILRNEYLQHRRRNHPITNADPSLFEDQAQDLTRKHCHLDLMSLFKHLALLPCEQRQAVSLVVAMGLTYEEAALTCKCAAGTIKSRVNRGKARLREALGYGEAIKPLNPALRTNSAYRL